LHPDLPDIASEPTEFSLTKAEISSDWKERGYFAFRLRTVYEPKPKSAQRALPSHRAYATDPMHELTLVHVDGTVVPLEGKPFDKVIEKGHGVRYQVKAFTLPDVQVGSILDFRFTLGYADRFAFDPECPGPPPRADWAHTQSIPGRLTKLLFDNHTTLIIKDLVWF
jgi:hypothetical protein